MKVISNSKEDSNTFFNRKNQFVKDKMGYQSLGSVFLLTFGFDFYCK